MSCGGRSPSRCRERISPALGLGASRRRFDRAGTAPARLRHAKTISVLGAVLFVAIVAASFLAPARGAVATAAAGEGSACDGPVARRHVLGEVVLPPDGAPIAVSHARSGPVLIDTTVTNPFPEARRVVVAVWFPYLASVTLVAGETAPRRAGSLHPAGAGGVLSPVPAFLVTLDGGESRPLSLCLEHQGVLIAPVVVLPEEQFAARVLRDLVLAGLCLGIVLAAVLHAFASWVLIGRRLFARMLAFALVSGLAILVATGLGKTLLWPSVPFRASDAFAVLQGLGLAAAGFLLKAVLLRPGAREPVGRLLDAVSAAALASSLGAVLDGRIALVFTLFSAVIGPVLVIGLLAVLAVRRTPNARAALVGWGSGQLATLHMALRLFDVTPYHPLNHHLVPVAITVVVAAFAVIAAEIAAESRSESLRDPLTGLANRRWFDERLAEEIAKAERTGAPLSIALVDLDHFKAINDCFGHSAGDEVLRQFAAVARTRLRRGDRPCRIGGEEFALLLPGTSEDEAFRIVDRLRQDVALTAFAPVRTRTVTISGGVARWRRGETAAELLKRADDALYAAKQNGRNRIVSAEQMTSPAPSGSTGSATLTLPFASPLPGSPVETIQP